MTDVSIVIPLLNEAESLPELHSWIKKVMNDHHLSYEVIFIDDGSTDQSWQVINAIQKRALLFMLVSIWLKEKW